MKGTNKMTEELQSIDLKELTERMDVLKDQKARLDFELKQVDKEIEKIELELANVLEKADIQSMDFGVYSFGWVEKSRKAFSQKAFGQVYPDLLEKFKVETVTRKLEFKINR